MPEFRRRNTNRSWSIRNEGKLYVLAAQASATDVKLPEVRPNNDSFAIINELYLNGVISVQDNVILRQKSEEAASST